MLKRLLLACAPIRDVAGAEKAVELKAPGLRSAPRCLIKVGSRCCQKTAPHQFSVMQGARGARPGDNNQQRKPLTIKGKIFFPCSLPGCTDNEHGPNSPAPRYASFARCSCWAACSPSSCWLLL